MKKWRLEAAKVNAEATKKENDKRHQDAITAAELAGKSVLTATYTPVKLTHLGRAAKRQTVKTHAVVSPLFWKLLDKGNIKFVRSNREIQAELDRLEAESVVEQDSTLGDLASVHADKNEGATL